MFFDKGYRAIFRTIRHDLQVKSVVLAPDLAKKGICWRKQLKYESDPCF